MPGAAHAHSAFPASGRPLLVRTARGSDFLATAVRAAWFSAGACRLRTALHLDGAPLRATAILQAGEWRAIERTRIVHLDTGSSMQEMAAQSNAGPDLDAGSSMRETAAHSHAASIEGSALASRLDLKSIPGAAPVG
jgi:hypothetical protein